MQIVQAHGIGTLGIRNEKAGRNAAHGNQPLGIGGLQVEWTGPDVLLIFGQMSQEVRLVRMGNGTINRDSGGLRGRCVSACLSCWLLGVHRRGRAGTPQNQSEHELSQGVRQESPLASHMRLGRGESSAIN